MLDVVGYVVLGLFLVMAPGFLFSLVLYPKLGSFDFWARMGVSLALGTMVAAYIGFITARAGMLQLGPFVGIDLALCVALGILTYFRGGFVVIMTYARAVLRFFRRFKMPKPPKPPTPVPELPKEQPPEVPKEQPPGQPPEQPLEESEGS